MEEKRIDMRLDTEENRRLQEEVKRSTQLCFRINNTMPMTEESDALVAELFDQFGEGSTVAPPIHVIRGNSVKIGRNVHIMYNFVAMSAGGITIEDDVMIAANVSLISNNHDLYDRQVLLCKPVRICKGAWIGAGAQIMPGVSVGRYAVVGAGSIVTKDVADYQVVVGNPARPIKELDGIRFE